jgi:uncharacterized metal-binding protein (TIGR02443 family)
MNTLRRFIAGAKCPACGLLDKLFLYSGDTERICECVACGFRDVLARDAMSGPAGGASSVAAEQPEVVRLIDPHRGASQ